MNLLSLDTLLAKCKDGERTWRTLEYAISMSKLKTKTTQFLESLTVTEVALYIFRIRSFKIRLKTFHSRTHKKRRVQ